MTSNGPAGAGRDSLAPPGFFSDCSQSITIHATKPQSKYSTPILTRPIRSEKRVVRTSEDVEGVIRVIHACVEA